MTEGREIATLEIPLISLTEQSALAAWPTRVKDFAAFIAATGYDATGNMLTLGADDIDWLPHGHSWNAPGFSQGEDHAVVGISYYDAQAFCAWLTVHEHACGALDRRYRYGLPRDLEWSMAIGLDAEEGESPEARLAHASSAYPWGEDWPPPPLFGNYAGSESRGGMPSWWGVAPGGYCDPFPRTSPVASFAPNARGFYDLSGNVWEWCADAYCPGSLARIVRGGSWGTRTAPPT